MDRMRKRIDARLRRDRYGERGCYFDKGGGGSAPPPPPAAPDPSLQIAAQAKAMPSQYTPFGSVVFSGDPNVAGDFKSTTTLSPEQQRLYQGRTAVAQTLLDRSNSKLGATPTNFQFDGATDPTTNAFFMNQKALLDRTFDRDEERLTQRLANQGLPMGSEAYDTEVENFRRSKTDAYERAATEAIGQGYGQSLSTRQQNLNEVAQALGGSQLQPLGGTSGSPVDVAGAYANQQAGLNRQYQGQLAGYNADVASGNSSMGGLFSLGAAALPYILSDRRLKRDIVLLGEVMPGINLYEFSYLWSKTRHQGVMADEVERVIPDAVIHDENGIAAVDYGRVFAGRTVN